MIKIHSTKKGKCSLSGKDCEGVVASFDDRTFVEVFLSWQSLRQLVELKTRSESKAATTSPSVKKG